MKSKKLARLCAVALAVTLATTSLMSGTLARYTTTILGEDTVTVARFGYTAYDNEETLLVEETAEINLFDNLTTDATGTVAVDGDSYSMLAPGTYGSFEITLDATYSDVDVEMLGSTVVASAEGYASTDDAFISYTIAYEDASAVTSYDVVRVSVADFAADLTDVLANIVLAKNTTGTIYVSYAWINATENDVADTALGLKWAGATADLNSEVTAEDLTEFEAAIDGTGTYENPSFTFLITNVASQVIEDGGKTISTSVSCADGAYTVS